MSEEINQKRFLFPQSHHDLLVEIRTTTDIFCDWSDMEIMAFALKNLLIKIGDGE
jgi:hypothetical protein